MLSVFMFLLIFAGPGLTLIQAIKGYTHSYREFALRVSEVVKDNQVSIVKQLNDESFDGFFFYFARHISYVDPVKIPNSPGYYLARREWLDQRSSNFHLRTQEILEGGRRTDLREERLVLFYLEPKIFTPQPSRLPSVSQAI